ncbi:hydroxymethylbilane synthase [Inhella inkyongensis]|uniref:Porphobilinogen deaminase n=1 Tax=Inhella inkyongensis TaxID=392593 RepID=A0A840SC36_9BURK|nr:hydroxymethylbilane synthase [Inhella inkyongensis]MBB5206021.1 hydroxymethylbilane synthase [Inhella inkyongensis]
MSEILRIATRKSRLALWQAEHVKALIEREWGVAVELVPLSTRGDEILDRSLSKVGGKGLFVKELEWALERGEADLAVHSLKDVPMALPEGFTLACVMEREDPRDAWVSPQYESLDALPLGARVGTSSLRRTVQLKALRPDLEILPLRGNLDTRLRKLDEGGFEAIVLAAAGLMRLGLSERIRSRFELQTLIPCAGQGALGIEVRSDRAELVERLAGFNHRPTLLACLAEREVSRQLGGSCSMPLAAHAVWQGDQLVLDTALGDEALAHPLLRARLQGAVQSPEAAEALGAAAAQRLRDLGSRPAE